MEAVLSNKTNVRKYRHNYSDGESARKTELLMGAAAAGADQSVGLQEEQQGAARIHRNTQQRVQDDSVWREAKVQITRWTKTETLI